MLGLIDSIGQSTLSLFNELGKVALFVKEMSISIYKKFIDTSKCFFHMNSIGVDSLTVIVITGLAVGSVLAWQSYIGLKRFEGTKFIGPIVFLSMVREFGPVLSAIMVAGRSGSAMTAELGTMQISEQVDALKTLGIDVHKYLTVPRIVGTTLVMPLLSLFCSLCGIVGGYIIAVSVLHSNHEVFLQEIRKSVEIFDIFSGLIKAVAFGFLLSLIAVYKGYTTRGGARNVGISTTESVVTASLAILVSDYILTSILSGA